MAHELDEYASVTRNMIMHESTVIDHRMTWLLTLQGLLFAAFAFGSKGEDKELVFFLSFVGTVSALSTFLPLCRAARAIEDLCQRWDDKQERWKARYPYDQDAAYDGPPVIGHRLRRWPSHILQPWIALPLILSGVWLVAAGMHWPID